MYNKFLGGKIMQKTNIIRYMNQGYFQSVIALGDFFGIKMGWIDPTIGSNQADFYGIWKKNGWMQGIPQSENQKDAYFELKSPIGKICGHIEPAAFSFLQGSLSLDFSVILNHQPKTIFGGACLINPNSRRTFDKMFIQMDNGIEQYQLGFNQEKLHYCFRKHKVYDEWKSLLEDESYQKVTIQREKGQVIRICHHQDNLQEFILLEKEKNKGNDLSHDHIENSMDATQKVDCFSKHFIDFQTEIPSVIEKIDAHYYPFIKQMKNQFTFKNLPLYQNLITACYGAHDKTEEVCALTAVPSKAYKKNILLMKQLNSQKKQ